MSVNARRDAETGCRWCGKSREAHRDAPDPRYQPRMPCLGLKSGFVADKPAAAANLAETTGRMTDSYAIAILRRMETADVFEQAAIAKAIEALEFRESEFDVGDMRSPAQCEPDEECPHIPPCNGHEAGG